MIKNWVANFFTRRAVLDSYELNADLIMKRFVEGDIVFELPRGADGEEGVVATSPYGSHAPPCRAEDYFILCLIFCTRLGKLVG